MKTTFLLAGAVVALGTATVAPAATQTSTQHSSHNPAIKDSDPARTPVAAEGANSFTEDQARGRLTDAGYTNVTGLAKDAKGVWRATATHGGKSVKVGLDYKGNVTTR
jgi:opacity protein-like surface antigen